MAPASVPASPLQKPEGTRSTSPESVMEDAPSGSSAATSTSGHSRDSTPPTSDSTPPPKKLKNPARVPIATGISTTIPVTGEMPRPSQQDDSQLEDDVLYAIFLILYEKDQPGAGMTVKQICDVLVEQHPEMANLSTKTSNLVSAKLNAYVKRVEKGDVNLKYALSREWADASPKRMVYVYRGLLTDDFHLHVKSMPKASSAATSPKQPSAPAPSAKLQLKEDSLEAGKLATLAKPRRQTMWDLGVTRNTFGDALVDKPALFVPYSSAPVAAALTESPSPAKEPVKEEDDLFSDDDMAVFDVEVYQKGKRSKSMSYLSMTKKARTMTAAAAAPRVPRTPSQCSPSAAAAAAALHAAALKAISASNSAWAASVAAGEAAPVSDGKWRQAIRSGFLSQEVCAPEDTSLSDIDKFFA
ncbi:protein Gds1p [Diutina catenulata]